MSYTKRYLDKVEGIIQDRHGYEGKIAESAVQAEAERIADTPSEFYAIMGKVKPDEALDWILEAWGDDDCDTIDTIAHDLLAAMDRGAKPDVSQEHLRALLAIAQRWGEDEVQRRGDVAEAEATRAHWQEKHGKDHPCAQCRRGMGAILSGKAKAPSTEVLDDAKANFATMMPADVG